MNDQNICMYNNEVIPPMSVCSTMTHTYLYPNCKQNTCMRDLYNILVLLRFMWIKNKISLRIVLLIRPPIIPPSWSVPCRAISYSPAPTALSPWSAYLYRKLTKKQRLKLKARLIKKGGSLVKVYFDKQGRRRVSVSQRSDVQSKWYQPISLHSSNQEF